jgi:plastocyanin
MCLLLASPAAGDGASAAPAPGCQMQRHGKRVVREVRRHGQLRKVRRTRHWWSCDSPPTPAATPGAPAPDAAPAATSTPGAAPAPTPPPEPEPELEPGPTRLSVKAAEYSYLLSRQTLDAGEVTIELDNRGQDAHNLNLQPVGSEEAPLEIAETESLQRRTARFTLQPGTYRLWCSLPTHDEEGMHATLVVETP